MPCSSCAMALRGAEPELRPHHPTTRVRDCQPNRIALVVCKIVTIIAPGGGYSAAAAFRSRRIADCCTLDVSGTDAATHRY